MAKQKEQQRDETKPTQHIAVQKMLKMRFSILKRRKIRQHIRTTVASRTIHFTFTIQYTQFLFHMCIIYFLLLFFTCNLIIQSIKYAKRDKKFLVVFFSISLSLSLSLRRRNKHRNGKFSALTIGLKIFVSSLHLHLRYYRSCIISFLIILLFKIAHFVFYFFQNVCIPIFFSSS